MDLRENRSVEAADLARQRPAHIVRCGIGKIEIHAVVVNCGNRLARIADAFHGIPGVFRRAVVIDHCPAHHREGVVVHPENRTSGNIQTAQENFHVAFDQFRVCNCIAAEYAGEGQLEAASPRVE